MKDTAESRQLEPSLIGVHFHSGEKVDQVLVQVAGVLRDKGFEVAGLVQEKGLAASDCDCRDMYLRDLQYDTRHVISESRGEHARGCRLDRRALAELTNALFLRLDTNINVLIVNRFGQAETEGQGLRDAITKGMELGCVVVVAYRDEYQVGWNAFHGGFAQEVRAEFSPVLDLVLAALGEQSKPQSDVPDELVGRAAS